MERILEKNPSEINLRNKELRVLLSGHFDMIHAGHFQLIQETKSKFKKVYLILGIINDLPGNSLLGLHEKIETFRNISDIDEICILNSSPTLEDLKKMNIDYFATANPNEFSASNKRILIQKKVNLSTDDIIARVIRDYDTHVDNLLQLGYDHNTLKISKVSEITIKCKRQLKKIKNNFWKEGFCCRRFENSIDSARRKLRNIFTEWSDSHEQILERWLKKVKFSTSMLYKLCSDIWDSA